MCWWKISTLPLVLLKLSQYHVTCYKKHSALSAVVFTNIEPPADNVHSEYYFGKCAISKKRVLLAHETWNYEDLYGKMIVRNFLDTDKVPTCVYIRTKSTYSDLVRYHSYKFNVCICTLVYNYGGVKYTYIYYEWYIPVEMFKVLASASCWQFFTSIKDFKLSNSEPEPHVLHSEYFFGHCKDRKELKFYCHQHFEHMDILGKVIVRGWLDLYRIPTCIMLRAYSHEHDLFRSTAYNFQVCVPRISYCHSRQRIKYYYYEWYLPSDFSGGMNWDMYFFGPESASWQ